jgi:hypothetical protein
MRATHLADRWIHLVRCADALEGASDEALAGVLRERLGSIVEVFAPPEPVEDLEGAAVHALAVALLRAVERKT